MVGDYTVINSMYIGHREIILGENPKAASGERYVCCYAERVLFYEQYLEAQVSDQKKVHSIMCHATTRSPNRAQKKWVMSFRSRSTSINQCNCVLWKKSQLIFVLSKEKRTVF